MSKAGKILKAFFVFILPMALTIDTFCLLISYNADYFYQGQKYTANHVSGFPFPDNGIFYEINAVVTSGNTTTNYTNYFLNKAIILTISSLIYFFLIRRISFESKKRAIILTALVTFLYVKSLRGEIFMVHNQIKYQYGVWPDKVVVTSTDFHWDYLWQLLIF